MSRSMLPRDSRGAIKSYSVQYWKNFGDKRDLCTLHSTKYGGMNLDSSPMHGLMVGIGRK